ncbi:hypothetical protein SAMN05660733_02920 [Lentzea albidocapillata]|uniref:Uncharacterized protein n=1 Tax=Lentzea albidocapillata TaxID=40571 RepID=A0A1W2DET0_9PSEU|nr:hypothetical protein SAMN05660733_02920 [Lentzea albidocapillata]
MRCGLDVHVHLRDCLQSFPQRADSDRVYVIELHDTFFKTRWSIGRVIGSPGYWLALIIGAERWTPPFPTRTALCTALMMIRGEHAANWKFDRRLPLDQDCPRGCAVRRH